MTRHVMITRTKNKYLYRKYSVHIIVYFQNCTGCVCAALHFKCTQPVPHNPIYAILLWIDMLRPLLRNTQTFRGHFLCKGTLFVGGMMRRKDIILSEHWQLWYIYTNTFHILMKHTCMTPNTTNGVAVLQRDIFLRYQMIWIHIAQ